MVIFFHSTMSTKGTSMKFSEIYMSLQVSDADSGPSFFSSLSDLMKLVHEGHFQFLGLFTPGLKMCCGQLANKWMTLNTGVNWV